MYTLYAISCTIFDESSVPPVARCRFTFSALRAPVPGARGLALGSWWDVSVPAHQGEAQSDALRIQHDAAPYTDAAHVTTLSTGAGDIRRKQEAVRFGQQQPQRRSHSASEAYRDRGVM